MFVYKTSKGDARGSDVPTLMTNGTNRLDFQGTLRAFFEHVRPKSGKTLHWGERRLTQKRADNKVVGGIKNISEIFSLIIGKNIRT